ncbi:polysaccharide pyruvyl transferase family protein [Bradyrhizobium sp. RT3b]|uniref:polysaccharide pyruvyl transferase family protein n=1 Tax=Bradyrhizobium sp. RT3b TaxID=3156334 RepID=UPI003398D632
MKLHFWDEKYKNFGDDLNSWIWSKYFDFSSSPDAPIFVGIGTIIDESIPVAERIIVFGSGAGYAKPPAHIGEVGFDIRFVRGPLSARLLKLDETKSITDPAILVADQFQRVPTSDRKGVVFVPHFKSPKSARLRDVCDRAGIEYVDPLSESRSVVTRISRAEKVIAESMHAAIVADAMRVPWLPVVTSPEISTFKWCDFSFSLRLPYCPVVLPATCFTHQTRDLLIRRSANNLSLASPWADNRFTHERKGIEQQMESFHAIVERQHDRLRKMFSLSVRIFNRSVGRLPAFFAGRKGGDLFEASVAAMHECALRPGVLSDERIHEAALSAVLRAIEELQSEKL